MFWFQRPPYLRWAAAILIVATGLYAEFRPDRSVLHPFVAGDVAAGSALSDDGLEWRRVPAGLLPAVDLSRPVAARDLTRGEPLLPSSVGVDPVPTGWWSVPVDLAPSVGPGTEVIVVLTASGTTVAGVVTAAAAEDTFTGLSRGLVALPKEQAPAVAVAADGNELIVLYP